jgi:hypothetical protein
LLRHGRRGESELQRRLRAVRADDVLTRIVRREGRGFTPTLRPVRSEVSLIPRR